VWKDVKPVRVELTVPLGARLNCEGCVRGLEGVRGGVINAGNELSPSVPTSLSALRMGWWTVE
jgi:hypothetical protein